MLTSTARPFSERDTAPYTPRAATWRPYPLEASDLLCIRSPEGEIGPWMHERFAITVIPSRAVVRLESRRSLHLRSDAVLLVPEQHVYAVRPLERARPIAVTLLLEHPGLNQRRVNDAPSLVTVSELVASTRELMGELAAAERPLTGVSGIGTLVERLVANSVAVTPARTSSVATPLVPVRDYLRARLSESIPTTTLAEMSGLTESHFIRAFHHEFGLPPHAYHIRLRLAHACELLAAGESVSTVAYECGFADQSHLSRKFKEVYKVAPGAWASIARDGAHRPRPIDGRLVRKARLARAPEKPRYARQWLR